MASEKAIRAQCMRFWHVSHEEALFLYEFHSGTWTRQVIALALLTLNILYSMVINSVRGTLIDPIIVFYALQLAAIAVLWARFASFSKFLHANGGLRWNVRSSFAALAAPHRHTGSELHGQPLEAMLSATGSHRKQFKHWAVFSERLWLPLLLLIGVLDSANYFSLCSADPSISDLIGPCRAYNNSITIPSGPDLSTAFYALMVPLVSTSVWGNAAAVTILYGLLLAQWIVLNETDGGGSLVTVNLTRQYMLLAMVFISVLLISVVVPRTSRVSFTARRLAEQRFHELGQAHAQGQEMRANAKVEEAKARAETAAQVAQATLAYTFHTLRNPIHSLQAAVGDLREHFRLSVLDPKSTPTQVRNQGPGQGTAEAAGAGVLRVSINEDLESIHESIETLKKRVDHAGRHMALLSGHVTVHPQQVNAQQWVPALAASLSREHNDLSIGYSVSSTVPAFCLFDPSLIEEIVRYAAENAVAAVHEGREAWTEDGESLQLPAPIIDALAARGLPAAAVSVLVDTMSIHSSPVLEQGPDSTGGTPQSNDSRSEGANASPQGSLRVRVVNIGKGLPPDIPVNRLLSPLGLLQGGETTSPDGAPTPLTTASVHSGMGPSTHRKRMRAMGLGLNLCRHLAKMIGGRVALYDEPTIRWRSVSRSISKHSGSSSASGAVNTPISSNGTSHGHNHSVHDFHSVSVTLFELTFPLHVDSSAQPLQQPIAEQGHTPQPTAFQHIPVTDSIPLDLHGLHLLVVDDEGSVRKATQRMLTRAGADVILANDGDELVAALKDATGAGRPFDAVLLDIIMRRMNGEEACLVARAAGYTDLPILAASGNTGPADVAEYLANGFTGILSKPFTLKDAVQALLKAGVQPARPAPVSNSSSMA